MLVRNVNWDQTADVVIVGYAAAGAVAAITAHDAGAQVLILEKQAEKGQVTNSNMSGGIFICPSDVNTAIQYLETLYRVDRSLYWTGRDIIRVWAQYAAENKTWMEQHGAQLQLFSRGGEHKIPGYETIELWKHRGWGYGFMNNLYAQVRARDIPVLYQTPTRRLLTNLRGQVIGVRASQDQDGAKRPINIGARRAVIMTCGGFEFNEEMKLQYLKAYPTHFYGSPHNTGDGVLMAQEVGASLWHMNSCSARIVGKFPDFPIAFMFDYGGRGWTVKVVSHSEEAPSQPAGFIIVDRHGRRFTSEDFKIHSLYYELTVYDTHRLEYPRIPSYWVFDQQRMEGGPLPLLIAGPAGPVRLYKWSQDNRAELDRGWIIQADTVSNLARKLGMEPQVLSQTVRAYNRYCAQGEDPDFHRAPARLIPLQGPPFYAVAVWPGGPNTQGGPRRNRRAQVLNVDGGPIPRLYAAGELGSVYGMLYPSGGGNLAECIAFGRIAGENAVREKPR